MFVQSILEKVRNDKCLTKKMLLKKTCKLSSFSYHAESSKNNSFQGCSTYFYLLLITYLFLLIIDTDFK